ncbi:MAG: hypothetical protein JSR67_09445 [Proteobacteria bacterium]|nr:hypothetical protein [Pseudomonadota bacterium]
MHAEQGKVYWFPAKRYGWGWGPPRTWQGWVVMLLWMLAVAAGLYILRHSIQPFSSLLFVLIMGGVLALVCYLTGEPPRWRWGGRTDD